MIPVSVLLYWLMSLETEDGESVNLNRMYCIGIFFSCVHADVTWLWTALRHKLSSFNWYIIFNLKVKIDMVGLCYSQRSSFNVHWTPDSFCLYIWRLHIWGVSHSYLVSIFGFWDSPFFTLIFARQDIFRIPLRLRFDEFQLIHYHYCILHYYFVE